jgi:hypothetical protein
MKRTILLPIFLMGFCLQGESQTTVVREWYNIYDGESHGVDIPNAATIDRRGDLYITGRSSGIATGQDYLTLKYSPSGVQLLALRYNSLATNWDEATAIAVDDSGSIYVTGTSSNNTVTIKYDREGSMQWVRGYPPDSNSYGGAKAIRLDGVGNVYVAGGPNLTVMKHYKTGDVLWRRTFKRDMSIVNDLRAFVVTPTGTAYATGVASEECPEGICRFDMVTLKYDPDGILQWVRYYTRNNLSDEQPVAVTLDTDGNVLVVGTGASELMFIVKYSPTGDQLWVQHYDGPLSYMNPRGIAVDGGNNVIVGGTAWNQEFDYYAMKYRPDGSQAWSVTYNHASVTRDFCGGLAVDRFGAVYMTGGSRFGFLGNSTCVTAKFDSSGQFIWSSAFNRPDIGTDYGKWVFVDSSDYVYVAGDGAGPVNGWDYLTIKLRQVTVGVNETELVPTTLVLYQNYPNPFNPSTTIKFGVSSGADGAHFKFVSLKVYDLLGREVATLVNEELKAGRYERTFSVKDGSAFGGDASGLASGVYLYRLQAGGFVETRKLLVIK